MTEKNVTRKVKKMKLGEETLILTEQDLNRIYIEKHPGKRPTANMIVHMRTDYQTASGVVKLGLTNARPAFWLTVTKKNKPWFRGVVLTDQGDITIEEAHGCGDYIPSIKRISREAKKIREAGSSVGTGARSVFVGFDGPGLREVSVAKRRSGPRSE